MSKPVVLIADKLAQSTVTALGDSVEVRWVDGPNRAELLAAVPDAEALLVRSATTVDAEVLEAAPKLKIVGRAGVGLDNVDIPAATEKGVMVVNAPRLIFTRRANRPLHCSWRRRVRYQQPTSRCARGNGSVLLSRAWRYMERPSVLLVLDTLVSSSHSV